MVESRANQAHPQGYASTSRASRATAPSPCAYTMTGFKSISRICGSPRSRAARREMICATAATSSGGEPRNPRSSAALLSSCSSRAMPSRVRSGGHQSNVLQNLSLHAAEAGEHDGTPLGVVAAPDDQFRTARAHRLDQDAVQFQTRTMPGDIGMQAIPPVARSTRRPSSPIPRRRHRSYAEDRSTELSMPPGIPICAAMA